MKFIVQFGFVITKAIIGNLLPGMEVFLDTYKQENIVC
jgi:hypothetical protein